jgi:hypothetical protein
MPSEDTQKKQPPTDRKPSEKKTVTIYRGLSLKEIVSVCDQMGIDPKRAKFHVHM